ncbi:MAG: FKBP-type peptidyl-prolyl cis-trans isomerase [Pseudomonadota bacterium]|nr:FKBP-type peptidyl-prolyl cis-trans isomerase [Pseudomonadota bacterium]
MKFKLPLIAAFVAVLGLTACGGSSSGSTAAAPTVAVAGTTANVKYTGWLYSATAVNNKGTQFDTGQFEFKLGAGTVIVGFDAAVTGMKPGEKKTVKILAAQAYGAAGSGAAIPPNSDLMFDIELVSLR